jgi:acetyltransferase-like isoleucine patch superfamily enzyme
VSELLPHDWFSEPLPANCRLGERSWIYSSFSFRHFQSKQPSAVEVGPDSGLYNGTFFDLGMAGRVSIGRYCTVVGAIFSTNSEIIIGDYVFVSHEVVIADDEIALPLRRGSGRGEKQKAQRETVIEDDVWIGAQAIILGGVRIGAAAIVGAGSVVNQDIPPNAIFAGNPGRVVGRASQVRPL